MADPTFPFAITAAEARALAELALLESAQLEDAAEGYRGKDATDFAALSAEAETMRELGRRLAAIGLDGDLHVQG